MSKKNPAAENSLDRIGDLIASDPELKEAFEAGRYTQRASRLITQMRHAAGLSQAQLAERLGVKPPRISEAENPRGTDGPTYRVMCQVAEACGFRWPSSIEELARAIPSDEAASAKQYFLIEADTLAPSAQQASMPATQVGATIEVMQTLLDVAVPSSSAGQAAAEKQKPGWRSDEGESMIDKILECRRGGHPTGLLRILGRIGVDQHGKTVAHLGSSPQNLKKILLRFETSLGPKRTSSKPAAERRTPVRR